MVGGRLRPRTDEFPLKFWERRFIPFVVGPGRGVRALPPGQPDTAYLGPYVMMPGATLAITSALYERAGGFPRTAIEEVHEDRALVNRVRTLTAAYGSRRDVVVYGSVRRLRAYGLAGTLGLVRRPPLPPGSGRRPVNHETPPLPGRPPLRYPLHAAARPARPGRPGAGARAWW